MKLYIAPSACSLSPHIVLREANLPFELVPIDLHTKKTKAGVDFKTVNPKGAVPAIELDDGQLLTEGAVIVQYLADRAPEAKLAPACGSFERVRVQEWLNYLASEIHKGYGPLFNPKYPEEAKKLARDAMAARYDYLAGELSKRDYIYGDSFTIADAYAFTLLRWPTIFHFMGIDLSKWPALTAYLARIGERPAVKAAIAAEAS